MQASYNGPWARLLRSRLEHWGWTQRQLAELLEVRESRISDWVHGRHEPSDAMKARIVERLMATPDEVAPAWMRNARPTTPPPPPVTPSRGAA